MTDDNENRLRAVEDAVARQAADMSEIRGYMRQLTEVAIRQEQHGEAVARAFSEIKEVRTEVSIIKDEQSEMRGAIKFIKFASGAFGFSGIAAFFAVIFGVGG